MEARKIEEDNEKLESLVCRLEQSDDNYTNSKLSDQSEPTSISENIELTSPENDRSLQEIIIGNIPISSPEMSRSNTNTNNPEITNRSNNNSSKEESFISLHALELFETSNSPNNILNEIIKQNEFEAEILMKTVDINNKSRNDLNKFYIEDNDEGLERIYKAIKEKDEMLFDQSFPPITLIPDADTSLKELNSSNHSTTSLGTSTDYKIYHDKSFTGSVEYQDILSHRDDHIRQLSVALEQVLEDRNRLQSQTEDFVQEIASLKEQLVKTTATIKKHNCSNSTSLKNEESISNETSDKIGDKDIKTNEMNIEDKDCIKSPTSESIKSFTDKDTLSKLIKLSDFNFDSVSLPLDNTFSPDELDIIQDIRSKMNLYIEQKMVEYKKINNLEMKMLRDELESEKTEHMLEVAKLREMLSNVKTGSVDINELRKELNEKHNKEMEELRTYFEDRCAEIEKQSVMMPKGYSEEIFSQQSRKMSAGSSICSELESEVYPGTHCTPSGDSPGVGADSNKSDLVNVKIQLQNKYHAELEILREDYENRIDELRIKNENLQENLEKKYIEQIQALKHELEELQKYVIAQQEVANSGDFEIAEVVQSYERRLQEQVTLAKVDIISALELQIQNLITDENEDKEWPSELLQLREIIIMDVKEQYEQEIAKLNAEFEKKISRAIEREQQNSLKNDEIELKKERDDLRKTTSYLRNLLAELMKYFTRCEDELNNTLVEELLKNDIEKDLKKTNADSNDSFQSDLSEVLEMSTSTVVTNKIKRVHFTPDVTGIISLIDESYNETAELTKDISSEFQTELDSCLERLKIEANAILSATCNFRTKFSDTNTEDLDKNAEYKISSLTRHLITEKQFKNDLSLQLESAKEYIQSLELDKLNLESQLEQITSKQTILMAELDKAKEKIIDLIENGRREIISQGYGENHITGSSTLGERLASMAELQERARSMLSESSSKTPLLHLVEELCEEGDRIIVDAKKDRDDLIQQIEAADKKLKAATQFMEEQAVERETERDEAQKEIVALQGQLREGERNRNTCDRINIEVERLETQMREMSALITQTETKKSEAECELKEAIDKIWVLRDIIRDLESQIEIHSKAELDLKNIATQLQQKIKDQVKYNEDLTAELESYKHGQNHDHLNQHIIELEDEVSRLRISAELAGPDGVSKQIKTQLNEIEKILEKRTKDLESLHSGISTTNCSSPSEDMSIRDQVQSHLSGDLNDADLPLEQLARLKDKLMRHSRVEDAAIKRIRDLEMQLFNTKQEFEEVQGERDILQEQLSEQLHVISSLQLRLDEQRLRVESVQKESNSVLEHKIYELENEVRTLVEKVHVRDKNIKQLNSIVEQTKSLLAEQQKQLNLTSDKDKEVIDQLHKETENLKSENLILKNRIQNDIKFNHSISTPDIPELLDSMLSEKNADIDRLKAQLLEIKNELGFFTSLNISKDQLINLIHNSKHKVTDMVSPSSEFDPIRRQEHSFEIVQCNNLLVDHADKNQTIFVGSSFRDSKYLPDKNHSPFIVPEVSTIEKLAVTGLNLSAGDFEMSHLDGPLSLPITNHKHVQFENSYSEKIKNLQHELEEKNMTIKQYEETINNSLQHRDDLIHLRKKLEFSEESLKETKDSFNEKLEVLKERERNLRVELAEIKMNDQEKSIKICEIQKECDRKDQLCMNIAKEKHELQNQIKELEAKMATFTHYEQQIIEKNKEIYFLEKQLTEASNGSETQILHEKLNNTEKELANIQLQVGNLEASIKTKDLVVENLKTQLTNMHSDVQSKNDLIDKYSKESTNMKKQCEELTLQIQNLEDTVKNKQHVIQDLEHLLKNEQHNKEDISTYQLKIVELNNILKSYQAKIESTQKSSLQSDIHNKKEMDSLESKYKTDLVDKDLKIIKNEATIDELRREVHHLQDFIHQKDKIITQMTRDSNSLHISLEAIQSKIQESGNVLDLKKRLRDEQNLTAALHEEVQYLKRRLLDYENEILNSEKNSIIHELKENLEKEHALNSELLIIRDNLMQELQILEEKVNIEKDNYEKLQLLLDTEKQSSNAIQMQDANIIQTLRERLEQALDHEAELEKLLETEKKTKEEIERKTGAVSLESGVKINDAHFELACVKMDLVKVTTENDILKSEFSTLNNLNGLIRTELNQINQLSELQKSEIEQLKEKIVLLKNSERRNKDIDQKNVKTENSRFMDEFEQERNDMKKQIEELRYNLEKCHQREQELASLLNKEQENQMNSPVPEKFVAKMQELTSLLHDNVSENSQMASMILRMEEEKKNLLTKIQELETRYHIKPPFEDPAARADHLFGKYLKAESYRKALIFQKRYLITLLATYQRCPAGRLAELQYVWPKSPLSYTKSKGVNKFRAVVYAVISVYRMQFIVRRWQTGKRERCGSSTTIHRLTAKMSAREPISNNRPWCGNSPPCKDRTHRRHVEPALGSVLKDSVATSPLQTPQLLSQYIDRFDNIQQRLGLVSEQPPT